MQVQPYEQGRSTRPPEGSRESSMSWRSGSDHHPSRLMMMRVSNHSKLVHLT